MLLAQYDLTHWGRATHICVGKLTIIGSDNGLSPGRRQAIIWTNASILLIGPIETDFSEILIGIQTFSFRKMHLKISSAKWRPFCLGLNEFNAMLYSLYKPRGEHTVNDSCWTIIQTIPNTYISYIHIANYNMNVWILARNDINFAMAAGLFRLRIPGVSCVTKASACHHTLHAIHWHCLW